MLQSDNELELIQALYKKETFRCPYQYLVRLKGITYLVVIAKNEAQKFYLKRSITKQQEFYDDFKDYFSFNFPIECGEHENFYYAVYPYIENTEYTTDETPVIHINNINKKYGKEYTVDSDLIEKIEMDFLSSYPQDFHNQIKELPLYAEYFDMIKKEKTLTIFKEHCDFSTNNILRTSNEIYLMDFEFSKNFQVVGSDLYQYCITTGKNHKENKMLKIKRMLMSNIAGIMDFSVYPTSKIQKVDKDGNFVFHYIENTPIEDKYVLVLKNLSRVGIKSSLKQIMKDIIALFLSIIYYMIKIIKI